MIEQIDFNHIEWLWMLVIIPGLFLLISFYGKPDSSSSLIDGMSGSGTQVRHPLYYLFSRTGKRSGHTSYIKIFIYWIVISSLVIALAEPVRVGKQLPDPPRQRDIVFIVDTSVSMVLKDYTLNNQRIDRMSVVRSMLKDFIDRLQGDRVSIIAFADTPHVLAPLTSDTHLLQSMLLRLRTGVAGRSSAPGNAITLAVKQVAKQKERHQILVLLSDAALPIGDISPMQAAQIVANAGLPLYTIAVGADTYSAEEQRVTGLVYHPADRVLLEKMAKITGAKAYLAGDSRSLQQAIIEIEQQKSNLQEAMPRFYRHSLYQWPLLLALLVLSLYQLRALVTRQAGDA